MTAADFLNLSGLSLITVGSICAALSAPTLSYGADGSVSMCPPGLNDEAAKQWRIAMHKRQKRFPQFLVLIAIGAMVQALAVLFA